MRIVDGKKDIKNHNENIVEASIYYQKNKRDKALKENEERTEKYLNEGIKYLRKKENVSEKEAEAVFEKIARKRGK